MELFACLGLFSRLEVQWAYPDTEPDAEGVVGGHARGDDPDPAEGTVAGAGLDECLGESGLEREEVLRLIAQTGHCLTWDESRRGAIQPGMDADIAVLDRDPLTCPEDEIKDIIAARTFLAGREVSRSPSPP